LTEKTLQSWLTEVSAATPTPGGGSVAALMGAFGCALGEMVVSLTVGKEKFKSVEAELAPFAAQFRALQVEFVSLGAEDAKSYEGVLTARRLPKSDSAESSARDAAIQVATAVAADVPLRTAFLAIEALSMLHILAQKGNPNVATDAGAGALACHAAALGAALNVRVNALSIVSQAEREKLLEQSRAAELQAGHLLGETLLSVQRHVGV